VGIAPHQGGLFAAYVLVGRRETRLVYIVVPLLLSKIVLAFGLGFGSYLLLDCLHLDLWAQRSVSAAKFLYFFKVSKSLVVFHLVVEHSFDARQNHIVLSLADQRGVIIFFARLA